MSFLTSNTMLMTERAMNYLWKKQSVIADNVANAETPGYKAKYVTFEQELRQKLEQASADEGQVPVGRKAMREGILDSNIVTHEANETARMDGNGVNVTEQNVELSRTYIQYQLTTRAFSDEISRLRAAIRG
ncbi:MAG: flagellar basal body rod protein FlgB [Butyricicoccus pullicaecorum]|nr:flagellar basal body rod protein FlgB [Butyricicoccus pullicaecorum]MBS5150626.1 flagellar basal body rod protein FlgB [Butyricicoccus pullicaecorum]